MEALCVLDTITANKTVQIQAADERRSKIHGCCVIQLGPEKYSKKYVQGFPGQCGFNVCGPWFSAVYKQHQIVLIPDLVQFSTQNLAIFKRISTFNPYNHFFIEKELKFLERLGKKFENEKVPNGNFSTKSVLDQCSFPSSAVCGRPKNRTNWGIPVFEHCKISNDYI